MTSTSTHSPDRRPLLSFFEEYPTAENLARLALLRHPVGLYLAAPTVDDFRRARDAALRYGPVVAWTAWWPILTEREGYWMSPFSLEPALRRVIAEIETCSEPLTVLWDAEPPLLRPSLFFRGLGGLARRRDLIRSFLSASACRGHQVVSCEYLSTSPVVEWLYRRFAVAFDRRDGVARKMPMFYTSLPLVALLRRPLERRLRRLRHEHGDDLAVALGTIAPGVFGTEPLLPPEALARDLALMAELQVAEVAVFRLGGLTLSYVDAIAAGSSR